MDEIKYFVTTKRIPERERDNNLFYYELRHYDDNMSKYVIERDNVIVNFYGTMITDKEILGNREYMEYSEFKKCYNTIRDYNLKRRKNAKYS